MSAEPLPGPDPTLTVGELARAWAEVAIRTTYLPMSGEEIEQLLARLIHRLVAAITAPEADVQAAIEVAAELIAQRLTGPRSLGRSIEVLAAGLPRLAVLQHVAGLPGALLTVLGALADGYAEALRQQTFDEQAQVNQALLKAKQDAERGMWTSEARFREIFSASAVGIVISDFDGTLIDANKAFADLVGHPTTQLVGVSLQELLHTEDDTALSDAYRKLTNGELRRFRRRRQLTDASGESTWIYLAGSVLHDADGAPTHHITIVEDFTELHLLQQELSDQTLHDMLTGLPNEHYFMSRLQEVLESADPSAMIMVCRVNLDCFSVINDGFGRSAGERLLRSVSRRLQTLVRWEKAMVARMGTDDFAILIEEGPQTPEPRLLATRINEELAEPIYIGDRGVAVSAGVGVVRRHVGGISPGELLRAADATLHQVKRSGRGQWGCYDGATDTADLDRYRRAAELPGAFEIGEVGLEFQPVRSLVDGALVALQALLRWDRADGVVVGHAECLELAEQTALVRSLGSWMLRQACAELVPCSAAFDAAALRLRVDLTPRLSQDPDLIAVLRDALSGTGLRPEQLRVGVPVVSLVGHCGDVGVDNVQVLAELGVGVVLLGAAAGPGYMAYLEDLPVAAVETAPQTISRIAARPGDDSVVARAVRQAIPLVHSTGATVIAAEVDTAAQAQWWRDAGADAARGAHFGHPVLPGELVTLLRSAQ
jgi:diguanylate cyclase (GGDEF)-like protein/PAS domain S-box-containing protein